MNKIQYIKLLALRGITELNGCSIAQVVRESGGEPTLAEMVQVNKEAMDYYIDKFFQEEKKTANQEKMITTLLSNIAELEEDSLFLSCLEGAGVDNWDGYGDAQEMLAEIKNEK